MAITIQTITTLDQCRSFQQVERLVWGSSEEDVVPQHILITASKNGGIVLGAYADDGPAETGGLVGVVFGWLGTGIVPGETTPRLKHCSHMAGVLPEWQGQRVGLLLKLAQRDAVLAQGITDWMTWTYDPLFRANAVFNIHRLGATCTLYMRDIYGVMTDALNRGVPSDRCQVDWWLASDRVQERLARLSKRADGQGKGASGHGERPHWEHLQVLPTSPSGAFRAPVEIDIPPGGAPLAVPLPDDIIAIRQADRGLSLAWRFYMRAVLERAFAANYTVVDCLHLNHHGWHYILTQR